MVRLLTNKIRGVVLILLGTLLFALLTIKAWEILYFRQKYTPSDLLLYILLVGLSLSVVTIGVQYFRSLVKIEQKIDNIEKRVNVRGDKILIFSVILIVILAVYLIIGGTNNKYSLKDYSWAIATMCHFYWPSILMGLGIIILAILRIRTGKKKL
jgi:hypothetical protein